MSDRLLPPPPVPRERAGEVWLEMIDAGEEMIRSSFERRFGPEQAELHYRAWCREQISDQDRRLYHLLAELSRREEEHARQSRKSG